MKRSAAIILDYPVYTETQAAKIVELANAAQSEIWKSKHGGKKNAPKKVVKTDSGKGSGLKGPKTRRMKLQLEGFIKFIEKNPIVKNDRSKSIGARAQQCWDKNKANFEKYAAKDKKLRGYTSVTALASAYRSYLRD